MTPILWLATAAAVVCLLGMAHAAIGMRWVHNIHYKATTQLFDPATAARLVGNIVLAEALHSHLVTMMARVSYDMNNNNPFYWYDHWDDYYGL